MTDARELKVGDIVAVVGEVPIPGTCSSIDSGTIGEVVEVDCSYAKVRFDDDAGTWWMKGEVLSPAVRTPKVAPVVDEPAISVCGLREPSDAVIPTSVLDELAIVEARAAEALRKMSTPESAPIFKVEADGCGWVSAQWLINRERARTYALKRKLEETEAALARARETIERMSPVGWRPAVCRCARLPRAHDWIESACTGRSGL